jgi:hypothetical protein
MQKPPGYLPWLVWAIIIFVILCLVLGFAKTGYEGYVICGLIAACGLLHWLSCRYPPPEELEEKRREE